MVCRNGVLVRADKSTRHCYLPGGRHDFLGTGQPLEGNATGFHLITDNGGFFPHGLLPALVLIQGVVFAFASIELVGTAAGECKDPQTMVPKAINSVIWRIGLFYVGSVVLLVLLLPWNAYEAAKSVCHLLF